MYRYSAALLCFQRWDISHWKSNCSLWFHNARIDWAKSDLFIDSLFSSAVSKKKNKYFKSWYYLQLKWSILINLWRCSQGNQISWYFLSLCIESLSLAILNQRIVFNRYFEYLNKFENHDQKIELIRT